MQRSFIFALFIGFSTSAALADTPAQHFQSTCNYYENRAFGEPGTERIAWLSLLSESCSAALRKADAHPTQGTAELEYLRRLAELRDTVIQMNVARFRDRKARDTMNVLRTVTPSGEYLIANQIGVMAAYETWLEEQTIDTAALP